MTDDLAEGLPSDDFAVRGPLFTVYAEPPSLLHLSGELDVAGAPALATALEPLTRRGGIIADRWPRRHDRPQRRLLIPSPPGLTERPVLPATVG